MALSYSESANLMTDQSFRGRVKVACLTFANYISNEANDVPAHNVRLKWASTAAHGHGPGGAGARLNHQRYGLTDCG